MKSFKLFIVIILLVACAGPIFAQSLTIHISPHRYLSKDKATIVNLDYQVPYNNLKFVKHKNGYYAELDINIEVLKNDSLIFQKNIRDNIGISNQFDAKSDKAYLNRVSFSLDPGSYVFQVNALDINSKKSSTYSFPIETLSPETILSDIELCSVVRPDSSAFLEKFHRGKTLYQSQPSLIFEKRDNPYVYLSFEVYTNESMRQDVGILILTVQKDSILIVDDMIDFIAHSDNERITLTIPLTDIEAGKYNGNITLQIGELSEERNFEFFVTEPKIQYYYVFVNPDDDYKLLRYFMGESAPGNWKTYSYDAKKQYVNRCWVKLANANQVSPESFIQTIRERVDYANKHFSHFSDGWTTDIGRIYIRHGEPDDVEKGTTLDDTRFVRKDFQIWKYRSRFNAVYLFLDIQMNGNYKLIYVNGDERESSNPNYMYYLGDDFDTSLLRN